MNGTAIAFIGFVVATASVLAAVACWRLSARAGLSLAAGLAVWLGYVCTLSWLGVIGNPALRPPGIVYVVVPIIFFVFLAVVRSADAGRIAVAMPIPMLIGLQSFRVGVELFLHQLWREGLVPRMLTFEGANLDIWLGASAPVVAWLATRGRSGERVALAWNLLGLLALANVVARSALTSPGPLNLLHAEVANRAIGTFPYTLIAGFFAPVAVILHVLTLRALASRRKRSPVEVHTLLTGSPA